MINDSTALRSMVPVGSGLQAEIRRGAARRFGLTEAENTGPPPPAVYQLPPLRPARTEAGQGLSAKELVGTLGALLATVVDTCAVGSADLSGVLAGLAKLGSVNAYDAILGEPNQSTGEVSTNQLRQALQDLSARVFDARTALEYDIGHIPGAINVAPKPGVLMSQYVSDAAEVGRIVGDKDTPIIVYCNGPFCGKSRRLGDELLQAGFTNVKRYQLGSPGWRALVGPMVVESNGVRYVFERDHTAAWLDARSPAEFANGSLPGACNVPMGEVIKAKDDGRLPMNDFNTRVVAFGNSGTQASQLAEVLVQQGFNNVRYFDGAFGQLLTSIH